MCVCVCACVRACVCLFDRLKEAKHEYACVRVFICMFVCVCGQA